MTTTLSTAGVTGAGGIAAPTPARPGAPRRRGAGAGRLLVLLVLGLYFLLPIAASVAFTVRNGAKGGITGRAYTEIPGAPGFAEAFTRSLLLAVLTVVLVLLLMVPTVVLVELRLRKLRTTVELLTLMPLVLPPIALVVGVRSVLSWAPDYFLNTPLAQAFFDLQTLTEAGRNLGASWPRVLVSVVLPVLRTSVLNAAFLTLALVLGEFTIAAILGFETFPTWI